MTLSNWFIPMNPHRLPSIKDSIEETQESETSSSLGAFTMNTSEPQCKQGISTPLIAKTKDTTNLPNKFTYRHRNTRRDHKIQATTSILN